jgi:hypothetical protein
VDPEAQSIPFEDRSRPFGERLLATAGKAFSDPVALFSRVEGTDILAPLLYGVVVGVVGMVVAATWQILFGGFLSLLQPDDSAEELVASTGMIVLLVLFSPLLVAISLFISSGLYHLMLLLVGDGKRGFAVTFRAVAYGSTPQLLGIVPFCGGIVGGIWSIVVTIIGAKTAHETDALRAIVAYFIPVVVCCGLILLVLSMAGFVAAFGD